MSKSSFNCISDKNKDSLEVVNLCKFLFIRKFYQVFMKSNWLSSFSLHSLLSFYKLIFPVNFHGHHPLIHLLISNIGYKWINSFLLIGFSVINQVMKLKCFHVIKCLISIKLNFKEEQFSWYYLLLMILFYTKEIFWYETFIKESTFEKYNLYFKDFLFFILNNGKKTFTMLLKAQFFKYF